MKKTGKRLLFINKIYNKTQIFLAHLNLVDSQIIGVSIDKILKMIFPLKTVHKKIIEALEISKQNLLINKTVENSFKRNQYLDNKIIKRSKMLYPDEPIFDFKKKNKKETKVKLDMINEKKDKLNPQNFFRKNLNKKRVKIHNYYVEKIKKDKKGVILLCNDGK